MPTKKGLLVLFVLANLELGGLAVFVVGYTIFKGYWLLFSYFLLVALVNCGLIRLIKGNWLLLSALAVVLLVFAAYLDYRVNFVNRFINQFLERIIFSR